MSKQLFLIFTIFGLIGTLPTYAQTDAMSVHIKDGIEIEIPLDSIESLRLVWNDDTEYYRTGLWYSDAIPEVIYARGKELDSFTFKTKNSSFERVMSFAGSGGKYTRPLPYIDSIDFTPYTANPECQLISRQQRWSGEGHGLGWGPTGIFESGVELRYVTLDDALVVTADTGLQSGFTSSIDVEDDGLKVLSATYFGIVEYDVPTRTYDTLLFQKKCTAAKYMHHSQDIIFYSLGSYSDSNLTPDDAGYYRLSRDTQKPPTFLRHHLPPVLGQLEFQNGFDISPDDKKLLIPSMSGAPIFVEYDMGLKVSSPLPIAFNDFGSRRLLWGRYSRGGDSILFCNYSVSSFIYALVEPSEIGVANKLSGAKQILDVRPSDDVFWNAAFPQWSPQENAVAIFVSEISTHPAGYASGYDVYILRLKQ